MNEKPIRFADPFGLWVTVLTRTNRFMVEQLEKAVALRMDSLKAYVDLGVSQVKVALKVTDSHSLHEFTDSQFAVLSFVGHRMLDDGRVLNEWSTDSCREIQQVARHNMVSLIFKY